MDPLKEAIAAIHARRPRRVVVLTGAGISAESGIPTFRGDSGLWRTFRAEELATPEAFVKNPLLVWEWYEHRRTLVRNAQPNAAHRALATLLDALVVTQNVDGLHLRAGSRHVIELHGSLFRTRCVREQTTSEATEPFPELPPHCACGALLRPDVVWFGEMLPEGLFARAGFAVGEAELMLVIGTSGVVFPAAGLVSLHRGLSIEINPNPSAISTSCTFTLQATAVEATPPIVEAILSHA